MSAEMGFIQRVRAHDLVRRSGRVRRILPTYIEADGPDVSLGALCSIAIQGVHTALAEVVRVDCDKVVLAPFEAAAGIVLGAEVLALDEAGAMPVGDSFLGRAVDALGRPTDGGGAIKADAFRPSQGVRTSPLDRATSRRTLETGIRAIDGLLTLGEGQRVGVFAPAGVGKTSLMSQLARDVAADRCVVCLVGERGREVEALWSSLPARIRSRTVLVAATSDQTAGMRARACTYAIALAEHWRSEGHHVLVLIDSITRLAMALREIGLAAGEPPTVRAYTPSVFAAIPKLVERCGAMASGGAISAIMTVLSETADVDDPISELMKSLLDGHIILSRDLAEQGHFPAIDVPKSVSRLASVLTDPTHRAAVQAAVSLLSTYESSRTLIEAGVYVKGADANIDLAIDRRKDVNDFLRQPADERTELTQTIALLHRVVSSRRAA